MIRYKIERKISKMDYFQININQIIGKIDFFAI